MDIEKFNINMKKFAPRRGIFAIILVVSFVLQVFLLALSLENVENQHRIDKGNKIVNQLSVESPLVVNSNDRIGLGILANRYQIDDDVAQIVITDANKNVLVTTGQTQNQTGKSVTKTLTQGSQELGYITVTMKRSSIGEILREQLWLIIGLAVIHILLFSLYTYIARPTEEMIADILKTLPPPAPIPMTPTQSVEPKNDDTEKKSKFIEEKLDTVPVEPVQTLTNPNQAQVRIQFFDPMDLLNKVTPEVLTSYLQLLDLFLQKTCDDLFSPIAQSNYINGQMATVKIINQPKFNQRGVIIELEGRPDQLAFASVILAKLFISVNQTIYMKHHELSRFALPIMIGASSAEKISSLNRLMSNHATEDGILLLFPKELLTSLKRQIQLRSQPHPQDIQEREMAWYDGMSEHLAKNLIEKHRKILPLPEK